MVEPAIFSPRDYVSYTAVRKRVPAERLTLPTRLLATYDWRTFDSVRRLIRGRYYRLLYGKRIAVGALRGVPISVLYAFIGSPAAATMLEELIALGVRSVVEVGLCGSIAPRAKVGDIIVANMAFVDEGTSSHYFKNPRRFSASPGLVNALEGAMRKRRVRCVLGGVWTTDAPYRETRSKLLRFRRQGALGVNMESSALFALAKYRGIEMASVQVVSDTVGEIEWTPSFHEKKVGRNLVLSAKVAADALCVA
jgi:uridine phosphorylase